MLFVFDVLHLVTAFDQGEKNLKTLHNICDTSHYDHRDVRNHSWTDLIFIRNKPTKKAQGIMGIYQELHFTIVVLVCTGHKSI